MCGILGGIYRDSCPDAGLVSTALGRLSHRGPDATGIFTEGPLFLGHRRLSIIDLDVRANQPMSRGSYVITFNGEIYNYRELRRELEQAGVSFGTLSDTEVIIELYRKEGVHCFDRLEGMFAVAIWDRSTRLLTLARDRFGEKPLTYYQDGSRLLFSSELPALELLVGSQDLELDSFAMGLYFSLSYVPAPYAPFRRMRQLEPGTWLQFHSDTWIVRSERYYSPGSSRQVALCSFEEAASEVRSRLVDSVRQRLGTADVPVATFLSGGIDSSIISAVAAQHSPSGIRAYSVSFPEDSDYDEAPYARQLAAGCKNLRHTVINATEASLLAFTDRTLSMLGEPFADASIIPTAYLCAQVDEKVILGGDGADELFAGYGVYAAMQMSARLPKWVRRLSLALPHVSNPNEIRNPLLRRLGLFRSHLGETRVDEYLSWRTYSSSSDLLDLGIDASGMAHLRGLLLSSSAMDSLRDVLIGDIQLNLPSDMLKKVDLASMQHGKEVRLPYLDSGLVEFALSLPEEFLIDGNLRKRVLREAFKDILPEDIVTRPKKGFLLPIRKWFRNGKLGEEFQALAETQVLLDCNVLKRLFAEHKKGARDNSAILWSALVFMKWQSRDRCWRDRHVA